MLVRRLGAVVAALVIAVAVIRNAAVLSLAPLHPEAARNFWPGHPAVAISGGMEKIGEASKQRRPIDPRVFAQIYSAAVRAPLSAQPFLVRGVEAQNDGDGETARRAFEAAQRRDPRSLAAAYFLADDDLRRGNVGDGLRQLTLLARLSPGGIAAATPHVAAFARNPANWPQMRALFRSQPGIEGAVLEALAEEPGDAAAILALADPAHRKPDSRWLPTLLTSLTNRGAYRQALAIWQAIGRGGNDGLLHDPDFDSPGPPPPFNWSFASSTVGLAERQPGKQLHVIFYGSADGVLASQLLTLAPGYYRLRMRLAGTPLHPEALAWSIRCNGARREPLASAPLAAAASLGWTFHIPPDCAGQWLELNGRSGDVAQQSEATIAGLSLAREGGA